MSQRRLGSLLNARLHAALPPATVLRMPGRRARALSILFRTKGWLTLAQLLSAWARELADDKTNADYVERNLTHFLIEDMINGRLDDAGPLADGRRLGLRIITPDNRAGYLDGQQARELLMPAGTPAAYSLVSHRLVVMKEAVLDFARRHELPAPSWWADATIGQREQIDASPPNDADAQSGAGMSKLPQRVAGQAPDMLAQAKLFANSPEMARHTFTKSNSGPWRFAVFDIALAL